MVESAALEKRYACKGIEGSNPSLSARIRSMSTQKESVVFGGGCFWCTEAVFNQFQGVESVVSGYAGGRTELTNYEAVSTGKTGHAEVIKVEYDPGVITFEQLLDIFFTAHDPTTVNRQGNDVGEQYRSVILCTTDQQKNQAEAHIKKLNDENVFGAPVVTQVERLEEFTKAETYHQQYYQKNPDKPYCQVIINPKVSKIRAKYAHLLKKA